MFLLLLGAFSVEGSDLEYREAMFARETTGGRMVYVESADFRRGDKVNLVLLDVGPFTLGNDGKHKFDLDLFVKDSAGQVVLNEPGLLGEQGHATLENDMAPSLTGIFTSHVGLRSGKYQMTVVIRDLVGGGILKVTKSFTLNAQLSFSKAAFARKKDDGQLEIIDSPVFMRGEVVHLIVFNVGTFAVGQDGNNWFDIHMLVTNPAGETVLDQKNLLGEKGKGQLEGNIADSPYGMFFTDLSMKPGQYRMKLIIEDRIGGQSVKITRTFNLK
jgi:hypothetical protein